MFNWLFKKTEFVIAGFDYYSIEVVGVSYYQKNITKIQDLFGVAKLVCENGNEFDSNAVKVMINGRKVGYLSRMNAKIHRNWLKKTDRKEQTVVCNYRLLVGLKCIGLRLDLYEAWG